MWVVIVAVQQKNLVICNEFISLNGVYSAVVVFNSQKVTITKFMNDYFRNGLGTCSP